MSFFPCDLVGSSGKKLNEVAIISLKEKWSDVRMWSGLLAWCYGVLMLHLVSAVRTEDCEDFLPEARNTGLPIFTPHDPNNSCEILYSCCPFIAAWSKHLLRIHSANKWWLVCIIFLIIAEKCTLLYNIIADHLNVRNQGGIHLWSVAQFLCTIVSILFVC